MPTAGEYGFLHPTDMFSERETIIGSTATLACLRISQKYVVVDRVSCTESVGLVVTEGDVLELAIILAKIDPSRFVLLRCHGAIKHQDSGDDPSAYDLLLDAPSNATAFRSLRDALESTLSEYPLNERIEIAVGTARAVSFLHAFHFVHKNIRPENIIIFRSGSLKLGNPFPVGFERFRKEDTDSFRSGDVIWQKNLYRHPQRRGEWPHEKFTMKHDVYSLGVILLELGLSKSFVDSPDGLGISDLILRNRQFGKPWEIKRKLVALARTELPNTFGQKYSEVVIACLTCLDEDSESFGNGRNFEEDQDGVLVGVQYIEKVSEDTQAFR